MEDFIKSIDNEKNGIVFFKKVNAGKRVYYIDVKKSRKDELFLAITESKKVSTGEKPDEVMFEKHKLFLYKEDFEKFVNALNECLEYIKEQNEISAVFPAESSLHPEVIHLDVHF